MYYYSIYNVFGIYLYGHLRSNSNRILVEKVGRVDAGVDSPTYHIFRENKDMKKITINNKEYTIEFSIEASLYDDCTKSVMDMFVKGGMVTAAAEEGDLEGAKENFLDSIANIPQKALTLFYAGLLEHHGTDGDKTVQSKNDAKKLIKLYIAESKKSFRDVMSEMMEQMAEDSFFDLVGLNQITTEMTEETTEAKSTKAGKNLSSEK